MKNKGQSRSAIGSFAANWGSDPQNCPSLRGTGPLFNTVLLGTTCVPLPNGISFRLTTLAGYASVTDRPCYSWSQKLNLKCAPSFKARCRDDDATDCWLLHNAFASCGDIHCQHGDQPNHIYKFSPKHDFLHL